VGSRIS